MVSKRLAREEGHRRKFLAVVDDTPECDRALVYAASRAARTGGVLVLLYVIQPGDFQHWLGVENIMRAEAMDDAEDRLARMAERVRALAAIDPELVIREGKPVEAINALIEEDRDIAILVLAAATGTDGPGPLVSSIAGKSGAAFPIPVTIVPGTLADEDIAAVA
ncbi:universal stress protein [Oharaeibacter diazotrophicus]|uniref:Nucleotide-binding universal stress UspA family protein n=1 Tax=Oharaeibacter diazotrophicus TaxID=1920512 RepID=A0A4R6R8X2_9HYPH|nr:universal stress protein [Oharaeibacter diazotrophicus]TDP82344.1 nucleotide-binding universal stress UspA family protein [Oharaeibacter diazotrophicus]BBE72893.1 universal stress protein family protein [Pleomorphomonas sp. SM30]GLS76931.1 universal stress protein A [Oharaeibacter diazotrophicus]